ncbi:thioester reductase domain-containing protein [Streptomyces sp. NPDC004376]
MSTDRQLATDPLTSSWASEFRSSLRTFARTHLPDAMMPSRFVVLSELPKLPNGKVNRSALPNDVPGETADTTYVAPRTAVEIQLSRIWRDLLGVSEISVQSSFFDLGGDSMTVVQMSERVREAYHVKLNLRRLFENPTIEQLARMVSSEVDPRATGVGNPRGISTEEMVAEAALPSDVAIEPGTKSAAAAPYRVVFLTGVTGYTGAFLLRELVDRSLAQIYVLVRAEDSVRAAERVLENMRRHGLSKDGDAARITAVVGNLGRPYLGLDKASYRMLTEQVEMIIHNGAQSNFAASYGALKPVNVLGTVEVLRLATRHRVKPVHYVSSLAVYPVGPGESLWAETERVDPEGVSGGYRQTKWVSDSLVMQAGRIGLPVNVYRAGPITGAQESGVCATDTFINASIKACIQLGAAANLNSTAEMVPVDFYAAAISHTALSGRWHGTVFNLPGKHSLTSNDLIERIAEFGYPVASVPYPEWYRRLVAAVERGEENELARFLPLFGEEGPSADVGLEGSRPVFDTTNLRAALSGSGIECLPPDNELIGRYLNWFIDIGYLSRPAEITA